MSLLVRKIELNKWLRTDIKGGEDVCADAITNCLKTTGNRLSVWLIRSEAEIDDAVLAIAAGQDHLETFHVVTISPEHIDEKGIGLSETVIANPVEDLRSTHRDLCELSYASLGVVAYHIAERIKLDKVHLRTTGQLKQILRSAVSQRRLESQKLSKFVREKIA